jgi:hypothetical protein
MGKNDDKVEVVWEIEDGYAGPSRPQYAYIPKDELAECVTAGDVHNLIDDYVKAAFEDRITYGARSLSVDNVLEVWNELTEQNGEES